METQGQNEQAIADAARALYARIGQARKDAEVLWSKAQRAYGTLDARTMQIGEAAEGLKQQQLAMEAIARENMRVPTLAEILDSGEITYVNAGRSVGQMMLGLYKSAGGPTGKWLVTMIEDTDDNRAQIRARGFQIYQANWSR